jgi:hypothetical protein
VFDLLTSKQLRKLENWRAVFYTVVFIQELALHYMLWFWDVSRFNVNISPQQNYNISRKQHLKWTCYLLRKITSNHTEFRNCIKSHNILNQISIMNKHLEFFLRANIKLCAVTIWPCNFSIYLIACQFSFR